MVCGICAVCSWSGDSQAGIARDCHTTSPSARGRIFAIFCVVRRSLQTCVISRCCWMFSCSLDYEHQLEACYCLDHLATARLCWLRVTLL
jgi:hypothetical protein